MTITSIGYGDIAPQQAYLAQYVTSKFAVEGLTDVWRRNLRHVGIAVALVKPGDFSTRMNPLPGASKDLTSVVSAVRDATTSSHPLTRYYTGTVARAGLPCAVACLLMNFVPDCILDLFV